MNLVIIILFDFVVYHELYYLCEINRYFSRNMFLFCRSLQFYDIYIYLYYKIVVNLASSGVAKQCKTAFHSKVFKAYVVLIRN